MAKQIINNTDISPDSLKLAFTKANANFTELYNLADNYMGIQFPTDGSQILPRTGNTSWAISPPFFDDIAVVLLADDLTENEVLATPDSPQIPAGADLTGASGQVMVRFKKFWYKDYLDVNGNLVEKRWSPVALPGYTLHPFFTDGVRTADYAYISAYEAGSINEGGVNKLTSVSGVALLTSVNVHEMWSRATARNVGQSSSVFWHDYDWPAQDLIQFYFYLVYASLDSQGELPGYTEASSFVAAYKRNTGRSNDLLTMNGSVDAELGVGKTDEDLAAVLTEGDKIANRFLFMENIFGHIWKMINRVAFDGRVGYPNSVWLTQNPEHSNSDDAYVLANYEDQGLNLTGTSGYIGTVHSGFIPKTIAGDSSSYFGDYFYSYLDDEERDYLRLVLAGGSLVSGVYAGVACRISSIDLGFSYSSYGSRLCAKNFGS